MALLDYLDDPHSVHVLERDDGYLNIIETSYYFKDYQDWHPVEQKIALEAKGRILDVGCGSGRSVKYFQEKGHEAVGIDISEGAIEAARRFGAKNCHVMDAMELDFPDHSFDTSVLLGNGLGLCGLEGTKMLIELHRVVKPKGLLLASSRDPTKTDNPVHLAFHQRNMEQGKPIGLATLRVNFKEHKGEWFDFYMLEPCEVDDFIEGSGWMVEKLIHQGEPIYGVVLRNTG